MSLTFKSTLQLLLPAERKKFFLFSCMDTAVTVMDIVLLTGLLAVTDFYIHGGHSSLLFFQQFFAGTSLVAVTLLLLLLFTVKNTVAYFTAAAQFSFIYDVASRLSEKKCMQFLEGAYHDYINTDAAAYIRRISQQPVEFAHYVLHGWQQMITQGILLLFTAVAISIFKPVVFLLLAVLLLPPVILVAFYIRKKTRKVRSAVKQKGETSLQYLKEALAGFVEGRVYAKESFFTSRYAARQQELNRQLASLQSVQVLPSRFMELAVVAGFAVLVLLPGISNRLSVPFFTLGAFMAAAYKIIPGIVKMVNHAALIKTYSYTLGDAANTTETSITPAATELKKIEARHISFGYSNSLPQQYNFTLVPGDMAGVSAASGKGKTTLLNLLLGFEEVQGGAWLFNDTVVTAAERLQYHRHIAYVKQQPFLLHDTVENNITLGDTRPDTNLLQQVLQVTGIQQWLCGAGNNSGLLITENGKNISGGQRQRIALARALYKNAAVMILDEPFGELDTVTEKTMLEYLQQLAASGKIIILVTHNSESLSYCNKIIWKDA